MRPSDLSTAMFSARYRRVAWIAGGGIADVYEAEDLATGSTVAIKRMRGRWHGDVRVAAHFVAEVGALRRLENAAVARLRDDGTTCDGLRFLVLDRLRGLPFDVWLATVPVLERTLAAFTRVLDVVAAVHRRGVVHGDLKPGNVVLTGDDVGVALIDFGLAVVVDAPPTAERLRGFGTPAYLAPELIAGAPRTVATDVYAAGVMLYELLTGAPPFTATTAEDVARSHLLDPVVPPSLRSELRIGRRLEEVALRALAKDPADRFRSATDLRDALFESRAEWSATRAVPGRAPWDHLDTWPCRAHGTASPAP
jgi:serine/threonine-protein kinase